MPVSCNNIWTVRCRHLEKVAITGLKYHYNSFNKKVDILNEGEIEKEWINNAECYHLVTPNLDIKVYIDASLMGWGIMDTLHPLRGLCHKSEIDKINGVELNAIEIDILKYCFNKN